MGFRYLLCVRMALQACTTVLEVYVVDESLFSCGTKDIEVCMKKECGGNLGEGRSRESGQIPLRTLTGVWRILYKDWAGGDGNV